MLKERIKNSEYLSPQLKSVLIDKVTRIESLDLIDASLKEEKLRAIEARVNEIEQEVIDDNAISSKIINEINTEFANKYGDIEESEKEAEFGLIPTLIIIAMLVFIAVCMLKECID